MQSKLVPRNFRVFCSLVRSSVRSYSNKGVNRVVFADLGKSVPYSVANDLMKKLVGLKIKQRFSDIQVDAEAGSSGTTERVPDILLLLEHENLYTNGRRNKGAVSSQEIARMASMGAKYYETDRGGEITFHGKGQLVIYPILDLKGMELGVKRYVNTLEDSVISTLASFRINSFRVPEFPGVWTSDAEKIAATGCHIQRYISSHGIALNIETDLDMFRSIVPCGLEGKTATSMLEELSKNRRLHQAKVASNPNLKLGSNLHSSLISQTKAKFGDDLNLDLVMKSDLFESVKSVYLRSFSKVFGVTPVPIETESPYAAKLIKDHMAEAKG